MPLEAATNPQKKKTVTKVGSALLLYDVVVELMVVWFVVDEVKVRISFRNYTRPYSLKDESS